MPPFSLTAAAWQGALGVTAGSHGHLLPALAQRPLLATAVPGPILREGDDLRAPLEWCPALLHCTMNGVELWRLLCLPRVEISDRAFRKGVSGIVIVAVKEPSAPVSAVPTSLAWK